MPKAVKSVTYNGQVYTKDSIKTMLVSDNRWLERSILAIYAGQTPSEQNSQETVEDNGIGFNGADAYMMSLFAKQIKGGRHLYSNQLERARKAMPKYAGQLLSIIEGKARG